MKRVLVLQHIWECPPGMLGEILQKHGISWDIVNVEAEELPVPDGYDAVIALGGSQHVYQKEKHQYFIQEEALIRNIVEQDIPFLGICLGGQLLADALGGTVKQHTTTEIGFYQVTLSEEGTKDPLFAGLPGYQEVFHWHEDIFDMPADSILLATSESTKNQAFRYGKRAYGLQYHIELDPTLLDLWLGYPDFKQSIIDSIGEEAYINIEMERRTHYPTYQEHTHIIFENFLRIGQLI